MSVALFAQDEIKLLRNLQALIGVRYIYHENFKNHATPNVALMYKPGKFKLPIVNLSFFLAMSVA